MVQILYALDELIVGADPFAATRLQFTTLSEIGAGPIDRDRSFNETLRLVAKGLELRSLSFNGTDIITIAWDNDTCVGLSIIQREGTTGRDTITWIHPVVRHCGLGTMMKAHALGRAAEAGITQIRGNNDPGSTRFYRTLGVLPA
ncbi:MULTISPECIES: GNAT family N-acetyltransferase [unclassified Streptomyces]|uniref:GNAT family N-acetyltransferase n=1 Tax=unclassified Streptomyces TaxID=2593676 RepID=UPI003399CB7B